VCVNVYVDNCELRVLQRKVWKCGDSRGPVTLGRKPRWREFNVKRGEVARLNVSPDERSYD
jgi:hypothetical protein